MADQAHAPEQTPDARVLGRLLLVQSTLHVMPQTGGMSDLVCRGLSVVPGVEAVAVCLSGDLSGSCGEFAARAEGVAPVACSPGGTCVWQDGRPLVQVRLQTVNRTFGCLAFVLDAPPAFAVYEPYIRNTANILAMILENREQESRLRQLNEELSGEVTRKQRAEAALLETQQGLERTVADRTLALVRLNEALGEEVRERRLAQDATAREAALNAALARLSHALLEAPDLGHISGLVLGHAMRLTGSRAGCVGHVDPARDRLVCSAMEGEAWRKTHAADGECTLGASEDIWFRGAAQSAPMPAGTGLVPVPRDSEGRVVLPGIARFLSAPAMVGRHVVGRITLADAERDYSEKDAELARRLADLYALAVQHERQVIERRELAEQVERAQRLEAVGVLAGGVAHDFRNLLQIVEAQVDLLLERGDVAPEAQKVLRDVARATERGAEITSQLLAFSRKTEIEARTLDLNEVARSVARMMSHTLPKMIRVELALDSGLLPVSGDPGQLEQVVLNLAVNARDAMAGGGVLRIATGTTTAESEEPSVRAELEPGPHVTLRVSDTGHGMDAATASRAFDPFFTTKAVGHGTGLGLAVAYGIVKAHRGHVFCQSTPGEGSIFTILLPAVADTTRSGSGSETAPADARTGTETVLLVDDEEAILSAMRSVLQRRGYHVLTAGSGESALALYRQEGHAIDVVVLDLGMPGMGGEACLSQILEADPEARVIVSSGYARPGSGGLGAAAFLVKPYRMPALLNTIRSVLDGGAPEREGAGRGIA